MKSPLDLSPSAARTARARAAAHFERAVADTRLAGSAAVGLTVMAFVIALLTGPELYLAGVVLASMVVFALARRHMNTLERRLWWHQARTGLVDALEEQRAEKSGKERVIDLRDSVTDRDNTAH